MAVKFWHFDVKNGRIVKEPLSIISNLVCAAYNNLYPRNSTVQFPMLLIFFDLHSGFQKGMLVFDAAQFDGILKKILEFNSALLSKPVGFPPLSTTKLLFLFR